MSKEARQWAERLSLPDPSMKTVLLQLAYMHKAGGSLFPSQGLLAETTGLSPRAVWDSLQLLEAFNLIKRHARSNGNRGRTSDAVELNLDVTAALHKSVIRLARKGLRYSRNVRSANNGSQLAPRAGAPRTTREGIGDLSDHPVQIRTDLSEGHCTREEQADRPRLRIVGGRDQAW